MNIVEEFDKAEQQGQKHRVHMGMSIIGDNPRKLWLMFRWSFPMIDNSRILRLFDLGNRIEDQVVDALKKSSINVSALDKAGKQYRCSHLAGHLGGSTDGVVKNVDPENPEEVMLLEVKAANNNRFNELQQGESYEQWSSNYAVQIQCYMASFNLKRTLVVVYNKNDSSLYTEIIDAREGVLEKMKKKAREIIAATEPPESPYSPTDYRIKKFMSAKEQAIYTLEQLPDDVNCRNCKHSEPVLEGDGGWRCNKFNKAIDEETQRQGCDDHIWLPALVNLPIESKGEDDITYMKGGKSITNAPKNKTGMNVFTSTEMRELSKSYYDPELIKKLLRFREEFGVDTRLEELTRDG